MRKVRTIIYDGNDQCVNNTLSHSLPIGYNYMGFGSITIIEEPDDFDKIALENKDHNRDYFKDIDKGKDNDNN